MAELTQGAVVNNRYTLLEYKGRGSFGEVWLAHDNILNLNVALKIYISLDQKGVDEFKSEYTTTLGLSHPQLLTASFFDVWESRPFLVMKYCDRGSSSNLVGSASELDVWQFIHDVAAGLEYLHELPDPIIHQDIKPDNILCNDEGGFLITDFGISKRMRSTLRKQSKRAIGAGATAYMGPERFGEDPTPVKASDIWSLGASAYELAVGDLPFSGIGGGMQRGGAALPNLPQGWNRNLNDLIRRMMAAEPWDRPTARQIEEYTRSVLEGNDISFEEWSAPAKGQTSKKRLFIGIGIGVVAVIAIALAIIFATGKKVSVNDDDNYKEEYAHLMSLCENDINIGSAQNFQSLIEARNLLDSLENMQEDYPDLEDYDEYSTDDLSRNLDNKLNEASKAWLEAGNAQLNIAHDYEFAIEPYQTAARLKASSESRDALHRIADATGCKGALMVVNSVKLDDRNLHISYNLLNDSPISGFTLKYAVKEGNKESLAQSTITLQPGRNQSVVIALRDDAPDSPTEISLYNSNLNFYNGQISNK